MFVFPCQLNSFNQFVEFLFRQINKLLDTLALFIVIRLNGVLFDLINELVYFIEGFFIVFQISRIVR